MPRTIFALALASLAAFSAAAAAQSPAPNGLPGQAEAQEMMQQICYATVRDDHANDDSARAECTCSTAFYADNLPPADFVRILQIMKIAKDLRDAGAFSPEAMLRIAEENGLTPQQVETLFAKIAELDAAEEASCGVLRG